MSGPWERYREQQAGPWEQYEQPEPAAEPQAVQPRRTTMQEAGRQVGLYARSAPRGVAGVVQTFSEPFRYLSDRGYELVTGRPSPSRPFTMLADQVADAVGLPTPETPTERVVGSAVELGSGVTAMAGGAQKAADLFGRVPLAQQTLRQMAANPGSQVVGGAASAAAGQAAKEDGSGPGGQLMAALVAGIAAPMGMNALQNGGQRVVDTLRQTFGGPLQPQVINQRINIALQSQGIDPATVTPAMRAALMEQVRAAMKTGQLDDAAVARLADYQRIGATPTRARLTLNPYDVTQEANASKLAAATGARDARLPQIANENNQRLITLIDDMGGAQPVDRFGQGSAVVGAVRGRDASMEATERALYDRVRSTAGGEIPLQRKPFMDAIYGKLNAENKVRFVPAEVQSMLDDISKGVVNVNGQQFDVPFDLKALDNLKTVIASAQRSTQDGNVRRALSLIRTAIDETPVDAIKTQFGGSQVVTGQAGRVLQQADDQTRLLNDLMSQARAAAASRRNWQESARGIAAALDDDFPADAFVERFIVSKGAGVADVERLADVVNQNPGARDAVRTAIVQHLKEAALGRGGTSQTGNFSGRQMQAAVDALGSRKLGMFFTAEEVETLRSMARVGSFEVFQPRGSAVNNSNTAAGLGSILQGITQRVRPIASKIPLGQEIVINPLENATVSAMQRPALNIPRALVATQPPQNQRQWDSVLLPMIYGGGLLTAPDRK